MKTKSKVCCICKKDSYFKIGIKNLWRWMIVPVIDSDYYDVLCRICNAVEALQDDGDWLRKEGGLSIWQCRCLICEKEIFIIGPHTAYYQYSDKLKKAMEKISERMGKKARCVKSIS